MNTTLVKALVAFVPVSILVGWSTITFGRRKTLFSLLQVVGAVCLVVVVLTHVCEALHLLPWMRWGEPDSAGHYVDLASAILGLTLLPAGYLLHQRQMRNTA
jgi:hypothetical protein